MSSPFQLLAQEDYSTNPQEGKKNPFESPFQQIASESNPINQFLEENLFSKEKSPFEQGLQTVLETTGKTPGFRQAAQVPLGIAEGTGYGIATNLLNLIGTGEAMSPDTIDELRIAHERQGLPFDEEKYLEAVGRVSETFPTVSNIARMTEEETGLPLEAKSRLDKFINFTSMATKLAPKPGTFIGMNTALQKPVLGTGVGLTKEVLDEIGLPEPLSELLSFFILKKPTAGAGSFSIGTKGKPSGMPKRGFERLTEPTEVPTKKIQQISDKLEKDFRSSADQIIKDSPIGETAENLKNDPRYKNESRELLNQAQVMADETPGTLPTMEYKKALLQQSQKQIKGFALNEYKKNYLKFMKEAVDNVLPENMTYGELVEQYRENNRGLGEYFEPGSSKALNRAKKDALLDQNRAIASVLEENNPELSQVFKEGNERWTKIMDAETIDNFVSDMFPEGKKVDFKHMKDLFDDPNYQRIFKRALGEEGAKAFELAVEDMLTAERPYKMMREAREKGFGDLAISAKAYLVNPKLGYVKAGIDAARAAYRGLFNFTLDKPQIGINFTKAVQDLKKGDFKAAEQGFKTVQAELESTPKQAKAEPAKAAKNETVEVKPTKVKAAPEAEQKKAANVAKFNEKKKFKTEKGSTYEVNEDGSTTRNKAFRPEHGPKEQGPQPKSEKTYFVSPEDANKLGEFQTQGGGDKRIIELPDGRLGVMYETGKDAGKVEARTVITPKEGPSEGLIPVESWKGGKTVHFGNKITEIEAAQPKKQIEHKPKVEEKSRITEHLKKEIEGHKFDEINIKDKEGNLIGELNYSEFKDPSMFNINFIESKSGKNTFINLLKSLHEKNPEAIISGANFTDQGASVFSKLTGKKINPHSFDPKDAVMLKPKEIKELISKYSKEKPATPTKTKEAKPKYPKTKEEVVQKNKELKENKSGLESLEKELKDLEKELNSNKFTAPRDFRKIEDKWKRYRELESKIKELKAKEKPAASLSESKVNEIKRQDISKSGLKSQKKYILDHVEEALTNPPKGDKVTFDVPGDGIFQINNNEAALKKFAELVEKKWPDKPLKLTNKELGKSLKDIEYNESHWKKTEIEQEKKRQEKLKKSKQERIKDYKESIAKATERLDKIKKEKLYGYTTEVAKLEKWIRREKANLEYALRS